MALLTGMTEDGREVPVQVEASGRLVAEGLQGPAGAAGPAGPMGPTGQAGPQGPTGATGTNDWTRTGTEISPKTAGDSVFTSGAVKVGGTTAAPNITLKADGGGYFANRVGIGVATPATELDVRGFVRATDSTRTGTGGSLRMGTDLGLSYIDALGVDATKWQELVLRGTSVRVDTAPLGTTPVEQLLVTETGDVKIGGNIQSRGAVTRVHADNAAAKAGGLVDGDIYRKSDGTLMIAF